MKPNSYAPFGKLIDIGSHCLHIHATGEGCPSIVLEAGGLSWCLDWHLVQTQVAQFSRVCSYDRAGFGWSNPGPQPRSSAQIVMELHALLTRVEIQKPFILVGASFGGHTVRLYAKNYPEEVAGVILVDARHEDINAKMPLAWKKLEIAGITMQRLMRTASRLRALKLLGKLMGEKGVPPILKKLPCELHAAYLEVGFQPKFFQANLDEYRAIRESDAQLRAAGTLGNLPLNVIRHGLPGMFAQMPVEQAKQAEHVWQELQGELANLSPNSRLLVAENSTHNIPVDQPDLVVEAIQKMVDAVRYDTYGKQP